MYQRGLKINEQIQSIQEKLKNINVDSNLLGIDIQELRNKATLLKNEAQQLNVSINEKEKAISDKNNEIFKLKQLNHIIQDYFEQYKVNTITDLLDTLVIKKNRINESISLLKDNLNLLEIENYNNGIKGKISIVSKEMDNVNKKLMRINNNMTSLERILEKLDEEYGNEASDFLNSDNSAIQMYYKYLNPTPEQFNKLFFEVVNNEDLYIKILENGKEQMDEASYCAEANMVLSSGQLNVLALSIFIATNEAQQGSYFDFIAIDDPIQNMDDVNRYSICDVLSLLNRQLIFSTHDQSFVNLFLKKNENHLENITLYMLDSNENKYIPLLL